MCIRDRIMAFSFLGGLMFGLEGFFWLGAIRLVFALHGQCFVNSICHMGAPDDASRDTSRNVPWLAGWHLLQGENWHGNHHAQPWCARLGWTVSYTHLRAHETPEHLVCRLLLEKKKK